MPIKVLMPALSPTMTEGKVARWLKNEGDKIKSGDVLAEIETDKATMEVEAVDEGTLGKIVVPGGTEAVKVNDVIAVILEEGEDKSALGKMNGGGPAPAPAAKAAAPSEAKPAGCACRRSGAADRRSDFRQPARQAHGRAGRGRSLGDHGLGTARTNRQGRYRGGGCWRRARGAQAGGARSDGGACRRTGAGRGGHRRDNAVSCRAAHDDA